jgi:hypothetical protein
MIYKKLFFKASPAGFALGSALMVTLTGCVGYIDGPRASVYVPPPAVEVVVQDNYVYYPTYGIYFNSYRNQYAYMEGGAWVSRPEPVGVSVNVLLASPSVRMNFHDSPANHHAEMARQYPRNWAPSGGRQVTRSPARKDVVPKTQNRPEKRDEKEHEGK